MWVKASRPVTQTKSPISAPAKASGMAPAVGSDVAAVTGSMITYATTTSPPATRSATPIDRPGATGRTGLPRVMRASARGISPTLMTAKARATPSSDQ